ncbi:FluG domain-containing protein, partial [Pleurostoma richardsiae]
MPVPRGGPLSLSDGAHPQPPLTASTKVGTVSLELLSRVQAQLAERDRPEEPPLTAEELADAQEEGNERPPYGAHFSDKYKALIVEAEDRWISFCATLKPQPEWKAHLKTLTWENKGLGEGFARFVMRKEGSRIGVENSIRFYSRMLWRIYRKHVGMEVDERVKDHILNHIQIEVTPLYGLRREPKEKSHIGPAAFTYLCHFRWVRDRNAFKLGLDRIDDVLIRHILMWTGCRRHELVYAHPDNIQKKVERFDQDPGAFAKVNPKVDKYIQPRDKECWVCKGLDTRTEPCYKVLCWEDVQLFIIRDPMGDGGPDRLAMQLLLRFHKGETQDIRPTWFCIIEETLPLLCPIVHFLAKALAEGAIERRGLDTRADPYFNTKLGMPAVYIPWKKEFWHKPVFRKTVPGVEGPEKSDDPMTVGSLDTGTEKLGLAAGLLEGLNT